MSWAALAEKPTLVIALVAYLVAFVCYAITWRSARPTIARLATGFMAAGCVANLTLVLLRWLQVGRPPFKSLYESLVFLALCIAVISLVSQRLLRTAAFGALASPGSVAVLAGALVRWDTGNVSLPPALQSGWFIPHVVVYFAAYAAFFFATIVAVLRLFRESVRVRAGLASAGHELSLDLICGHALRFGFALMTVGFLIGSVWARTAWGDYWVWDPKENWSLGTWLVYAANLHLRHVAGWRGRRGAWLTIAGFAIVLFTYLGMGLLPTAEQSVHVYQ